MKVNMWMIANRLTEYDFEIKVNKKSEALIESALPFRAPGCAYVYQENRDLVCESEEGFIKIKDVRMKDGYLLIQNIINWYQQLLDVIDTAIMGNDFMGVVNGCCQVFQNPVMLQDSNYQLLGMQGFSEENEPEEWKYVREQRHSSIEGYEFMSNALRYSNDRYKNNVRYFKGRENSIIPYGGLHASISFQGNHFEKLTVFEYCRKINYGDICFMEYLSKRMAIYLSAVSNTQRRGINKSIFESLIMEEMVPKEEVEYSQKIIKNNRPGSFAVLLLKVQDDDTASALYTLQFIKSILYKNHPSVVCTIVKGELLILLYGIDTLILGKQLMQSIEEKESKKYIKVGISGEFDELKELYYFFKQARYAQRYSNGEISDFYSAALKYILESNLKEQYYACEPMVKRLWNDPEKKEYMKNFQVYLQEERSSTKASKELFVHKNTLTYRIKYLKELTGWDLENAYVRDYIRISIYILERNDRKR